MILMFSALDQQHTIKAYYTLEFSKSPVQHVNNACQSCSCFIFIHIKTNKNLTEQITPWHM